MDKVVIFDWGNICQAFGYELDKIEYSVEEFLK